MTTPPPRLPPYLLPDRSVHVIISTKSGSHNAQPYYNTTLQPLLAQHSIKHQVHTTTSHTTIATLCSKLFIPFATKGVKQTLLLLSGDGGVIDIVNTIATTLMRSSDDYRAPSIFVKPVIVLFPLGTANALATSAGISNDPLEVLLYGTPKPLPIFEVTFSKGARLVVNEGQSRELISPDDEESTIYGAVVFSWGLHASLVATSDTTEYRKHGVERFKMAAAELLKDTHVYRGKVSIWRDPDSELEDLIYPEAVDGTTVEEDSHVYILAPLVSTLDPGFLISPSTITPSNTLYLLAIAPVPHSPSSASSEETLTNASSLTQTLTKAYQNGTHVPSPNTLYHPITSLRIEMNEPEERWRQVCVDGKIVAVKEGGWVEVRMLPGMGMDGRRVVEIVVPS